MQCALVHSVSSLLGKRNPLIFDLQAQQGSSPGDVWVPKHTTKQRSKPRSATPPGSAPSRPLPCAPQVTSPASSQHTATERGPATPKLPANSPGSLQTVPRKLAAPHSAPRHRQCSPVQARAPAHRRVAAQFSIGGQSTPSLPSPTSPPSRRQVGRTANGVVSGALLDAAPHQPEHGRGGGQTQWRRTMQQQQQQQQRSNPKRFEGFGCLVPQLKAVSALVEKYFLPYSAPGCADDRPIDCTKFCMYKHVLFTFSSMNAIPQT